MFHRVQFIGHLGRDPEMRYTPGGQAVTSFSVAAGNPYTDSEGNKKDPTIWFQVSCWGKLAEVTNQFLKKGKQVFIEGRLQHTESGNPRTWDRDDGEVGVSFQVNAQTVKFLGKAGDVGESHAAPPPADDDIPF